MISIGQFCGGVSAAIVVKLTSSIDDVLWLSAFLTPNLSEKERSRNALTYACVCLLQTCLAFFISAFGQVAMDKLMGSSDDGEEHISSDRVLTLLSGSALFIYSIVLGFEYYNDIYGDDDDDDDAEYAVVRVASSTDDSENTANTSEHLGGCEEGTIEAAYTASSFEAPQHDDDEVATGFSMIEEAPSSTLDISDVRIVGILPMEIDQNYEEAHGDTTRSSKPPLPPSDKQSRSLAVIAFLGSLDDLTLFVPMLVGKTFGIFELIVGAMISTFAIVIMCIFLTRCQMVADALEKVPLVAIVSIFCIVLLTKGIFFMV
jgi:hypothetical protein